MAANHDDLIRRAEANLDAALTTVIKLKIAAGMDRVADDLVATLIRSGRGPSGPAMPRPGWTEDGITDRSVPPSRGRPDAAYRHGTGGPTDA